MDNKQVVVDKETFEEFVKQTFFYCTNKNPEGLYANEVDLLEFSARLIAVWEECRCQQPSQQTDPSP